MAGTPLSAPPPEPRVDSVASLAYRFEDVELLVEFAVAAALVADLERGQERALRNLDLAELAHPLLAFLLLLQQLLLARDVAAVALGQHVLAQRLDVLARNDVGADGRLDRHVEHLPGDQLLHLLHQLATLVGRVVAVDDQRQGIDPLAVDQHVQALRSASAAN